MPRLSKLAIRQCGGGEIFTSNPLLILAGFMDVAIKLVALVDGEYA
jgi:hypothetical protein